MSQRSAVRLGVVAALAALLGLCAQQDGRTQAPAKAAVEPLVLREALVIPPVGKYARAALHLDALEALLVAGKWQAPKAGDRVALPGGSEAVWEKATARKDGSLAHRALRGGYAYWAVPSDKQRVLMLEASGHSLVYINGTPRTGDPYQNGYVHLPVLLEKGTNELLFHCARGSLRARLIAPKGEAFLDAADALIPDLLPAEKQPRAWGAVLVVNASNSTQKGLALVAELDGALRLLTVVPPLPPLSTRKVGIQIPTSGGRDSPRDLHVLLKPAKGEKTLDRLKFATKAPLPGETYRRTFVSAIDGSVQYYAVRPARPLGKNAPPPALFLTLHGASVEATGQANAYSAKTWGHLVAPTNRRPFGFDWEDWGRLDALEVLNLAQKELRTDPARTYLTGHSMGGHGTWHVGATYPDRFAAIGPSAGWVTFWTYAAGARPEPKTPMQGLLRRCTTPSETLLLARNYAQHGVYVLHGDADDNVPVRQARLMKKTLESFHRDWRYHEQPKAGHWWDASPEPGADCVDWAPMFDFFARRVIPRPEQVRAVEFVTASPGVSARCQWVTIAAQTQALKASSVSVRCDPGLRRFTGKTENVARLQLDLQPLLRPDGEVAVELDGQKVQKIAWPAGGRLWLRRAKPGWAVTAAPSPALKGPRRYGPFRDAFRNHMAFVYGTKGTAAENAWALAKARYDAETFWYRGNGSVDVLPDSAFASVKGGDRNVILYGNADTNGAWRLLLGDSPVQVRRGTVTVDKRTLKGDGLACLFLRPRPGSEVACVGVVSGSGISGMRLTDRLPYFVSGVGYPDCIVLGPEVLREGSAGVRAAGFFGLDWSVTEGEFVWATPER